MRLDRAAVTIYIALDDFYIVRFYICGMEPISIQYKTNMKIKYRRRDSRQITEQYTITAALLQDIDKG